MHTSPGGADSRRESAAQPKASGSSRSRSVGGMVIAIFSALQWLLGCGKPASKSAPHPTLADLKFPVVLIQDGLTVLPRESTQELLLLHSNYLNINGEVGKTLIDSDFNIYTVLNLRSTRGGLGQMMNPVGVTPVTFTLAVKGHGLESARSAIAGCKYLGGSDDDVSRKRNAIGAANTLAGMIKLLQGDDSPVSR